MKIGALHFLDKTSQPSCWTLAAWHSRHSLTWRWVMHVMRFRGDERRWCWPPLLRWRTNYGLNWTLVIPWVCRIEFQQQHSMFYRDMYERQFAERERLEKDARQTVAAASSLAERISKDLTVH